MAYGWANGEVEGDLTGPPHWVEAKVPPVPRVLIPWEEEEGFWREVNGTLPNRFTWFRTCFQRREEDILDIPSWWRLTVQ